MQHEISSAHFVELMAAELLEPRGEYRADLRAGIIASTVANSAPFRSKTAKVFGPADFIPKLGPQKKKTGKEIMAGFRLWTEANGGEVRKERG